jgi:uncharacterized membrane protein YecN with MAPEG domain
MCIGAILAERRRRFFSLRCRSASALRVIEMARSSGRLERTAMPTALPFVAAAYAALFGLIATVLTARVIMNRVRSGIQAGDGGDAALARAIRAHANFAEQVPLALLLLVLVDGLGVGAPIVHALGATLVVARLANALGLSRSLGPTPPRQAGAALTLLVIVAASLLIFYRLVVLHS